MYLHKSKIKQVTERDSWIKQAKCKVTFLTQCNIKQLDYCYGRQTLPSMTHVPQAQPVNRARCTGGLGPTRGLKNQCNFVAFYCIVIKNVRI